MNLESVVSELGAQLRVISGLRVYEYPADSIQTPAAVFALPENVAFDLTYQRGGDRLSIELHVLVAHQPDRITLRLLSPFMSGSGASSIKEVLEQGFYTAFHFVRVESARSQAFTLGAVDYFGSTFTLDVVGSGD